MLGEEACGNVKSVFKDLKLSRERKSGLIYVASGNN